MGAGCFRLRQAVLILSVDLPSRAILPNREPIPLSQSVEEGATANDILSYWRFEKATHPVREMSILFIPLPIVQDDCDSPSPRLELKPNQDSVSASVRRRVPNFDPWLVSSRGWNVPDVWLRLFKWNADFHVLQALLWLAMDFPMLIAHVSTSFGQADHLLDSV